MSSKCLYLAILALKTINHCLRYFKKYNLFPIDIAFPQSQYSQLMLPLFLQYCETPLYAASFSHIDIVNMLLEHNADPNIRDKVSCLMNLCSNTFIMLNTVVIRLPRLNKLKESIIVVTD